MISQGLPLGAALLTTLFSSPLSAADRVNPVPLELGMLRMIGQKALSLIMAFFACIEADSGV